MDCRPSHLYQFAVLAQLYVKNILRIERPRIALLSNGSEDYKGNALVKDASVLLAADKELNFVGYTEGHTLLSGNSRCNGLRWLHWQHPAEVAEGIAETILGVMKEEIKKDSLAALAAKLIMGPPMKRVRAKLDYAQFGGAPLLGHNGNVVICMAAARRWRSRMRLPSASSWRRRISRSRSRKYMEKHLAATS